MPILLTYGLAFVALTTAVAAAAEFVLRRRRAERERLLRPGGFQRWVDAEREGARAQVTRLTDRQNSAQRLAARLTKGVASIRDALMKGKVQSLAWISAGAIGFTALWALAVKTEVGIDASSFRGLGYPNGMAMSLAFLTALMFCVLGIVLSDLIGLTHLLPGLGIASTTARVALIGTATLALAAAASQLPRLAEYRSAPIAAEVQEAQNAREALTLLPPEQRPAILVGQAETRLAEAKAKLDTARYVDKRLAIGAAVLEAATSWAAAWSLLLIAYLLAALLAAGATWRADAAGAAIRDTNQRFYARVVRRAEELEIEPTHVAAILSETQNVPDREQTQPESPEEAADELPAVPVETTTPPPAGHPGAAVIPEPEPEVADAPPTWAAF